MIHQVRGGKGKGRPMWGGQKQEDSKERTEEVRRDKGGSEQRFYKKHILWLLQKKKGGKDPITWEAVLKRKRKIVIKEGVSCLYYKRTPSKGR